MVRMQLAAILCGIAWTVSTQPAKALQLPPPKPVEEDEIYLHVKTLPIGNVLLEFLRETKGDFVGDEPPVQTKPASQTTTSPEEIQILLDAARHAREENWESEALYEYLAVITIARIRNDLQQIPDMQDEVNTFMQKARPDLISYDFWNIGVHGSLRFLIHSGNEKCLSVVREASTPLFWYREGTNSNIDGKEGAGATACTMALSSLWFVVEYAPVEYARGVVRICTELQANRDPEFVRIMEEATPSFSATRYLTILAEADKNIESRSSGRPTSWSFHSESTSIP